MSPLNPFAKRSRIRSSEQVLKSSSPLSQAQFSDSPLKQRRLTRSSLTKDSEAGNTFRQARNLGTFEDGDVEIRNGRTNEDDPDFFKFKFDVDGQGRIQVRAKNNSLNGSDLEVYLYNSKKKLLDKETGIGALDVERVNYTKARTGTYFLKVIGDDDDATRYTLSFHFRD